MPYSPQPPVSLNTLEELRGWLEQELRNLALAVNETQIVDLRPSFREPDRVRDGMTIFADGTNFNPNGFGRGPYTYINGQWAPLINVSNAPVLVTGTTYAITPSDSIVVLNSAVAVTVTLPSASLRPGRIIRFKTVQNVAVNSASANVIPLSGTTPGTVIIPASGKNTWVDLIAAGANWVATAGA
jgi:hypothetical protein